MIRFHLIEPGMLLYDRHREKAGNTTMTRLGEWSVKIIDVDREREKATVSWNGNPPRTWYRKQLEKLYRSSKDDGKSTGKIS